MILNNFLTLTCICKQLAFQFNDLTRFEYCLNLLNYSQQYVKFSPLTRVAHNYRGNLENLKLTIEAITQNLEFFGHFSTLLPPINLC